MAIKEKHVANVQRLLKLREERVLDLERVENGAIDCTIHGAYQWNHMADDIQLMFRDLMVRHAQRRLDDLDELLKRLGFEIEREEYELL